MLPKKLIQPHKAHCSTALETHLHSPLQRKPKEKEFTCCCCCDVFISLESQTVCHSTNCDHTSPKLCGSAAATTHQPTVKQSGGLCHVHNRAENLEGQGCIKEILEKGKGHETRVLYWRNSLLRLLLEVIRQRLFK